MSMTVEDAVKNVTAYVYMEAENIPTMVARALDVLKDKARVAEQFEAIGTVSEFQELKEKATAKKPIETERNNLTVWDCPKCGNELYSGQKFCDECGSAIADEFD